MFNNWVSPPLPFIATSNITRLLYYSHCFYFGFFPLLPPSLLRPLPPFPYLGFFFRSHITSTCRGHRRRRRMRVWIHIESGTTQTTKEKNNTRPRLYNIIMCIYTILLRGIGPDLLTIKIVFIIPIHVKIWWLNKHNVRSFFCNITHVLFKIWLLEL